MKVLVVSSKYPPEYAGSGLRAHNTYLRLQKKYDIEFEVICNSIEFDRSDSYVHEGVPVQRIVSRLFHPLATAEVPIDLLDRATGACKWVAEALRTLWEFETRDFDVIHTFGYSASTALALYWSRVRGVPLLTEVVNAGSPPYQQLPVIGRFYDYDLTRQCVVVAISTMIGEKCAKYGLDENVWVRPNPVDSDRFSPYQDSDQPDRSDITPFNNEDTVILYVASFRRRKNHEFLLEVLPRLPEDFKLVLAGPVDDSGTLAEEHQEVLTRVEENIDDLGLEDRVFLKPEFVDMAEYLSVADVFCFPSWNEGMGTPLLESLCSGVPVVANASEPSFQEWIVEGENGYLRKLHPEQWALAIENAASIDAEQREKFSNETLRAASDTVIDRQYYELLNTLAVVSQDHKIDIEETLHNEKPN